MNALKQDKVIRLMSFLNSKLACRLYFNYHRKNFQVIAKIKSPCEIIIPDQELSKREIIKIYDSVLVKLRIFTIRRNNMYACIYDFDFGNEQVNSLILLIDNVYIKIKLHSFNTPALYLWQKNNHYFQAHIINGKLIYTYRNNEKGYKKEERKCKLKQAKVKYILQKSLQKQDKKILCKINEKNNR